MIRTLVLWSYQPPIDSQADRIGIHTHGHRMVSKRLDKSPHPHLGRAEITRLEEPASARVGRGRTSHERVPADCSKIAIDGRDISTTNLEGNEITNRWKAQAFPFAELGVEKRDWSAAAEGNDHRMGCYRCLHEATPSPPGRDLQGEPRSESESIFSRSVGRRKDGPIEIDGDHEVDGADGDEIPLGTDLDRSAPPSGSHR